MSKMACMAYLFWVGAMVAARQWQLVEVRQIEIQVLLLFQMVIVFLIKQFLLCENFHRSGISQLSC